MQREEFYSEARDDLTGPLAGVRVLEATTTWAGPMAAAVLADFGADVVKVEIPTGDVSRHLAPKFPDTQVSIMSGTVNRNKRSLSLDVRADEGREIFLKLVEQSDIVIENFKVGTMGGYGLGYEDLKAIKPDIVYVSITGWGQFGPNHEAAGYDPLAQAASGFMSVNGTVDGPPVKAGIYLADDLGGLHGALGAMAALRHRDQTGEGQHVDIALLDAMLFQSDGMPSLGALGIDPTRSGNEFGFAVPANVYDCKDGAIFCGVLLDSHWEILAPILGEPDLATNPAFATRDERVANRDVCNMMVGTWLADRTRDEALTILREAGLPVAPVQSYSEAAKDEHVLARDMIQHVELPDGKAIPVTGPAAKFSRTPTKVRTPAPNLGQHNEEILAGLGIDAASISALKDKGVVG